MCTAVTYPVALTPITTRRKPHPPTMKDLIHPHNTIQFLKAHGISAKKRYGQNFLIDERVLSRIIDGAAITKNDFVLEIGPGIGTLTQALCEAAGNVTAVELDRDMLPLLDENLADCDNYKLINDDILNVDLESVITDGGRDREHSKIVANLPYYITTPIIMKLLESRLPISSVTVMVQKEVADRMQAEPGTKDYGALSLAVRYYAKADIIAKVPPNCFTPRPGVDSAVVSLKCCAKPPVEPDDDIYMFRLIKAAFAQRRKTLANALKNDNSLKLTREGVESALRELGLDENIRGERLSLADFARLSDKLGGIST